MNRNISSLLKIATVTAVATTILVVPMKLREAQRPTFALFSEGQNSPLAQLNTVGAGINDKGECTGTAFDDDQTMVQAFIISGRDGKLLPSPSGVEMTIGRAINNSSEVAGIGASEKSVNGIVWRGGSAELLKAGDDKMTVASAITPSGVVLGNGFDRSGGLEAYAWSKSGTPTHLGQFLVYGANDKAAVGGKMVGEESVVPVVFTSGGKLDALPLPSGCTVGLAFGLNEKGTVVGAVGDKEGNPIAAVWNNGRLTTPKALGGAAIVLAANNNGDAVGIAAMRKNEAHACLWRGNKVIDLNDAVGKSDWVLVQATGINNKNEIVGTAINQKENKASVFVLRAR
jgi:uncharacterized membrane protein